MARPRQTRGSTRSASPQARYDWDAHATTRERNAEQMSEIPGPKLPATGTSRISKLLAAAGPYWQDVSKPGNKGA